MEAVFKAAGELVSLRIVNRLFHRLNVDAWRRYFPKGVGGFHTVNLHGRSASPTLYQSFVGAGGCVELEYHDITFFFRNVPPA